MKKSSGSFAVFWTLNYEGNNSSEISLRTIREKYLGAIRDNFLGVGI
jgi:hypothetical protein